MKIEQEVSLWPIFWAVVLAVLMITISVESMFADWIEFQLAILGNCNGD